MTKRHGFLLEKFFWNNPETAQFNLRGGRMHDEDTTDQRKRDISKHRLV